MNPSDRQRFSQMADNYDQLAPRLVPMYDFLQDEMIRQADLASIDRPRVVDLGAGSGRFLEKVLIQCPHATCWWVDSSESFLDVAFRRLGRFAGRVTYVIAPIEGDWPRRIDAPVDAIFSMSAIHHLESSEKRAAYAAAFDALHPGGWFINTDEMRTLDDESYRASLQFWARSVDRAYTTLPEDLTLPASQWKHHFDNWKRRNIDAFNQPKTKGDDLHEPFVDQVRWLRDIGYERADVFIKYHLWCAIGGRKPNRD